MLCVPSLLLCCLPLVVCVDGKTNSHRKKADDHHDDAKLLSVIPVANVIILNPRERHNVEIYSRQVQASGKADVSESK